MLYFREVDSTSFLMTLGTEIKTVDTSAVAKSIAWAFLCGYSVPFVTMLGPYFLTTDYVGAVFKIWNECLTNQVWLFLFFKSTLNCGVSFTLGYLTHTNAFQKVRDYLAPDELPDLRNFPGPANHDFPQPPPPKPPDPT